MNMCVCVHNETQAHISTNLDSVINSLLSHADETPNDTGGENE